MAVDYAALRAVAAVVRTGSFERAAASLNVTPSAVSQRIKHLEERLGAVLIERGTPCTATDKGLALCRHMDRVGMLEKDLMEHLPELSGAEGAGQVTLNVATNADSLGTWFLEAIASFTRATDYLVNVAIDDEDHTADWLRRGRVLAAVTSLERPVQGCRVTPLGALRYQATASPDFVARYFPDGLTKEAFQRAPALTFDQKDRLQNVWAREVFGQDMSFPTHWLPSTQSFLEGSLAGMGWALNPVQLARRHLERGDLVELAPGQMLERHLFWQINRLAADQLHELSRLILTVARRELSSQA
ncbi:MAG: LysR family transcriptional regulator ArgP [Sulfitobacter sp.]|uniref:LysR family transcriptional regulator ArgP n=2 Tax=Alphaproteobacteria TaxID=28211 RepID=A0A8F6TXB9_9RHOB|nr:MULTISPECIES: LysR family transcriptional regulator ArgP [Rhodobacterales]QXT39436.1 LysR family transcriptional regulator ArgP [Gymnodinialimonas ceratoperidinii]UOA26023.1 putative HTH-type transcriptional regulator [Pseudosulfitobacter sp. DSM 107133]HCL63688.1 ArgP/LysG family DNA-binding transcriptional regulator [Rhizobium sp.]|tara:strand:- start:851 stop:1756 length:906 start_codon:yes stop_codon:yes gene_type:complete